jgi:hypothetical protein
MRFAAPVLVGQKRDRAPVGQQGHAQRRGDDAGQVIAGTAGEIEDLGATRVRGIDGRAAHQVAPAVRVHEREHEIAPGVDIVHAHDELAKARLAEVLVQQLDIAPRQLEVRRLFQVRRASHEVPHHAPAMARRIAGRNDGTDRVPPDGPAGLPSASEPSVGERRGARRSGRAAPAAAATSAACRAQMPRQPRAGTPERVHPPRRRRPSSV